MSILGASLIAYLASVISGVVGFGGAMIFLPVLVWMYGARAAVPILTVSVLLGNASRVYFNRRELDMKLVLLFSLGSLPFAVLGSFVYVALPVLWIKKSIGLFLLIMVGLRHVHKDFKVSNPWVFTPLGAVTGFLSALMGGVGPISSPFFLAYGLVKEAFVGTEALCAVGMHLAKSITYNRLHVLNQREIVLGLGFGLVMTLGSYTARKVLEKLSREKFLLLVEIVLTLVGFYMMIHAD
ncbi:MAG: sulfite exporter TauE/SafE family protein [Candidatus Omnitrophica bacterium]|nr:sulfite exporter TauE/SafE family protein [Candidatus Omnitrophota bacterium]